MQRQGVVDAAVGIESTTGVAARDLMRTGHRPPSRLRHTAASVLLAQGVPARVVMEILGHSQISVTLNTYAHVAPEVSREAADRVDQALWGDA